MHEVGGANEQHALVVLHRGPIAACVGPRVGLALLLDNRHQLIREFFDVRALGVFAGVTDDATASATGAAATAAESATTAAATTAESATAATEAAAATAATLTLAALRERRTQVEVGRVVEGRWFEEEIANRVHAQFACCGNCETILRACFDEAFADLPRAGGIRAANLKHALKHVDRWCALDRERDFKFWIDTFRATFACVTHDQRNAELLCDVLKRGLGWRLVEGNRDIDVEQRTEELALRDVIARGLALLLSDRLQALREALCGCFGGQRGRSACDDTSNERASEDVVVDLQVHELVHGRLRIQNGDELSANRRQAVRRPGRLLGQGQTLRIYVTIPSVFPRNCGNF